MWNEEEIAAAIAAVQKAENPGGLRYALEQLVKQGVVEKPGAVRRKLWGVLTRYRGWKFSDDWQPAQRTGPATHGEQWMVLLALGRNGEANVDRQHLARAMGRSASDVDAMIKQFGPAQGRSGFFY